MLEPDPFAGLPSGEPPDFDDVAPPDPLGTFEERQQQMLGLAPLPTLAALGGPIDVEPMTPLGDIAATVLPFTRFQPPPTVQSAPTVEPALTPVLFPMLAAGAVSVPFGDLSGPARRVAELVEAIQPVLAPPAAIAELEQLVARANALTVTSPETYTEACELYELLRANEKGIEGDGSGEDGSIGAVVAFFHRPWKAMCEFRARFAKPTLAAALRLSDLAGAWKLAEDKRAQDAANAKAQAEALAERDRLREISDRAAAKAKELPAGDALKPILETAAVQAAEAATEVVPIAQPVQSNVPSTSTKGRKKLIVDEKHVDVEAFYKALLEDPTRRVAAPIDFAYLNRQVTDLGEEISKRFPGITAIEKGGLTAGGRK